MAPESVQTWDAAVANFAALVSTIDPWDAPSPCPGWSIADLVSHTIDMESMLAGDVRPEHTPDWSGLPHVQSDFGRMTEIGVDCRRGLSPQVLLNELSDAHARARARIETLGLDAVIPWFRGDTPIPQLLSMRTFDIWVHEQDVRVSTGNTGNLDGPGAAQAMKYLSAGLPKVWGKSAGAPIGSVLQVAITEPGLSGEFWVRVNEDGRASLVEEQAHDVSISMPWLSFVMLAGGRATEINVAESVVVTGNEELGALLIDRMAVTP
ncbi:MAG TPA: maleylpyruvate isomerase family mycothiol-dependent enzyme [Acidimicrobiia bacterium]